MRSFASPLAARHETCRRAQVVPLGRVGGRRNFFAPSVLSPTLSGRVPGSVAGQPGWRLVEPTARRGDTDREKDQMILVRQGRKTG